MIKSILRKKNAFIIAATMFLAISTHAQALDQTAQKLFPIPVSAGIEQETPHVIPSGNAVGIKVHSDGIIVAGITDAETSDGRIFTPAKDAGLKTGDIIKKIDDTTIESCEHFSQVLEHKQGSRLTVEYVRDDTTNIAELTPINTDDGWKIGAWIRDSIAGIGTITFVRPDTKTFAALGHGISDTDTGQLINISSGSITQCSIESAVHGEKGTPGELKGVFTDNELGVIMDNSSVGIYGKMHDKAYLKGTAVPIAARFEVKPGKAKILSTVEGDSPKEYDIEIEEVITKNSDGKGMVIKISDERLLAKTGGIAQGMSGSPIMQGGRLVGAVTHVLVNDPTRGYGIFIELMMDKSERY